MEKGTKGARREEGGLPDRVFGDPGRLHHRYSAWSALRTWTSVYVYLTQLVGCRDGYGHRKDRA